MAAASLSHDGETEAARWFGSAWRHVLPVTTTRQGELAANALAALRSSPGLDRLTRASTLRSPAVLSAFRKQQGLTFCAIATLATAKTALLRDNTCHVTERDVYTKGKERGTLPPRVEETGMTLQEVAALASSVGLRAEACHADVDPPSVDDGCSRFRQTLQAALAEADGGRRVVAVNYHMTQLGQGLGFGHVSMVGAYDPVTDTALVLDCWPDTEAVWAPTPRLWRSMTAADPSSGRSRGYITLALQ
eukprot:m.152248 g.152248  ORF g.152248 m.152248 type:complete len:248 (-) comp17435_c3_seq2:1944-2687(-)